MKKINRFNKCRAWAEINLQNLRHNVSELRRILPEGCALMPVVKADAYGHGAVRVARVLNGMGIRAFCVATVKEGIELRKGCVKGEILVLGYTNSSDFGLLRRYRLTQTVIDYDYAMLLDSYGKKLKVHVKIDTGMHRFGEWVGNTEKIAEIFKCKNLQIKGIYTHLSSSDSATNDAVEFTQKQVMRFQSVLDDLAWRGFKLPQTHVQSSYGVLNYPELRCDYARVGIALYGAVDESRLIRQSNLDLRPVLTIKARVALVRNVAAGEPIGYGLACTAERDMKLAVLSLGYSDGIPRGLSSAFAWVIINGQKASIVGNICMDSILVDVTEFKDVSPYDIAVIMGGSLSLTLSAVQIAALAETIPNEILSRLGKRLGGSIR